MGDLCILIGMLASPTRCGIIDKDVHMIDHHQDTHAVDLIQDRHLAVEDILVLLQEGEVQDLLQGREVQDHHLVETLDLQEGCLDLHQKEKILALRQEEILALLLEEILVLHQEEILALHQGKALVHQCQDHHRRILGKQEVLQLRRIVM